jgi:hypothetical protein
MEMVKPRDYTSAAAVTAQLAVVAILTVAQVRLANLTAIMRGANFINPDGPDPNCCELLYARSDKRAMEGPRPLTSRRALDIVRERSDTPAP